MRKVGVREFTTNLSTIRQKAKESGISDDEIDACFRKLLKEDEDSWSGPGGGRVWRAMKFALKIWLAFLVLIGCANLFLNFNPVFEKRLGLRLGKLLSKHQHVTSRTLRKLALPFLHRRGSLTAYYDELCLVYNPKFANPLDDCVLCSGIKTIKDATGRYRIINDDTTWRPFTVQDSLQTIVSYIYLQWLYSENSASLNFGTAYVASTNPSITSLADLFSSEAIPEDIIDKDPQQHNVWVTRRVAASILLRQMFVRPYFVPNENEVSLEKRIYIDGPEAPPYKFPIYALLANTWYAQADGTRRLVLTPNVHCQLNCTQMEVVMNATNVLFYNNQLYTVESFPVQADERRIGVGFLGTFE